MAAKLLGNAERSRPKSLGHLQAVKRAPKLRQQNLGELASGSTETPRKSRAVWTRIPRTPASGQAALELALAHASPPVNWQAVAAKLLGNEPNQYPRETCQRPGSSLPRAGAAGVSAAVAADALAGRLPSQARAITASPWRSGRTRGAKPLAAARAQKGLQQPPWSREAALVKRGIGSGEGPIEQIFQRRLNLSGS